MPALVVAGPNDSTYAAEMLRLAGQLNLRVTYGETDSSDHPQVYFPGMLQGHAKWGAFYGCSAFVLPSHQENFGIAVVEALACGKQVLISNQVNIFHEIETSYAGLVANDTLEGTISLLRRHMHSPGLTNWKYSRCCYEQYFCIDSTARKFLAAIDVKKP